MFHPDTAATMRAVGLLKRSGRCYTWDARADGIVFGEASLAAILSALPPGLVPAICVRGVTVRQDGRTAVLTAPNGSAQQVRAIVVAIEKSDAICCSALTVLYLRALICFDRV